MTGERASSAWQMEPRDLALCAALFAGAMAWFWLTLTRTFDLKDEGYFLYAASRVAAGAVPHRDFADIYGPGPYWLNALVLRWFDGRILPVRIVVALFKASAVVVTYLLARPLVSRPAALLSGLLAIVYWGRYAWNLNAPYGVLYTLPLCMVSAALLPRALQARSALRLFASGVPLGLGLLFKQTLPLLVGLALALAIFGVRLLERPRRVGDGRKAAGIASVWLLAGLAFTLAFASQLSVRNYLLHLLPIHAVLGLFAVATARREAARGHDLVRDLAAFTLGAALVPVAVGLLYASWGALDDLFLGMFVFPATVPNYAIPLQLPPLDLALAVAGAVALQTAALLALGSRTRPALLLLVAGTAALVVGALILEPVKPEVYDLYHLWSQAPPLVEPTLGFVAVAAALGVFGPVLLHPERTDPARLAPAVCLFLFQTVMIFHVFPRASWNVWILTASLAPLFGVLFDRWLGLARGPDPAIWRRRAAAIVALALPLWLTAGIVHAVLDVDWDARRAIAVKSAEGIRVDARTFRRSKLRHFERLVAFLERSGDAPVFLLSNQWMILYASGRPALYRGPEFYLAHQGYDMLPLGVLDDEAMLQILRATPDAVVIEVEGKWGRRIRLALPRVSAFVDRSYSERARFGPYRVLTRSPRGGARPDPAAR